MPLFAFMCLEPDIFCVLQEEKQNHGSVLTGNSKISYDILSTAVVTGEY